MFFKLALCLLGCGLCYANILDMPSDIKWTKAINAKLCEAGNHPDDVAAKFFACYNETITPGGNQFITCMTMVYGVKMDSESNIDVVCNGSSDKFPKYAACILTRLPAHLVLPSTAMHKLNQCQGGVLGVPAPA